MKKIRIIGGGIAGLTAAINLRKAGFAVEVHERKSHCGKNTNDFQYLENWTFDEDTLDMLTRMQIQTNFYKKPLYSQEIIGPSGRKYVGLSDKPVMYAVKRGEAKDSIDRSLEAQCRQIGIDLFHNSTLKRQEADIIATGIKKPSFLAMGIIFPCVLPDKTAILFDDNLSEKFYAYFVVHDNVGEITCINPVDIKDHKARLDNTVKRFEEILMIKTEKIIERFSAPLNFEPLNRAYINNQYFVGEAAGFQDCLFGFGMLYAFKSGYLAAKSILEDSAYDQLLNSDILNPIKTSVRNRKLFEKLSNRGYERLIKALNSRNPIIKKLLGGDDLRQILKRLYNNSLSHFLRPLLFW
jgi:flavin-dependent dehydrogenase